MCSQLDDPTWWDQPDDEPDEPVDYDPDDPDHEHDEEYSRG